MSQEISSKRINSYKKPNKTERKGLVTNRIGQGWYRLEVLKRWNSKCAVTNCGIEKILIASHIVAWKESNNSERLDVGNGILLCPNIDSLFDKHFISFQDNGKIIISTKLKSNELNLLGVDNKMKLRTVFDDMKPYLARHRKIFNEYLVN